MRIILLALSFVILGSSAGAQTANWTVKYDSWTPTHEKRFSEWVQMLGQSGCATLKTCLTSASANPWYAASTPKAGYRADCADLPYALRAYFAWMEGLPFDYVSSVSPSDRNGGSSSDIRYTTWGNQPSKVIRLTKGNTYNAVQLLNSLVDNVSTAMYRMHYRYKSDFYPAALNLKSIRPGSVLYDASGHAAIIWKVEKDGRIHMMDAHPDQSITRISFSKKFSRSRPDHGAGFKNWRPELNTADSDALPNFSTEQFNKSFAMGGESVDYYDYVRMQMAGGSLSFKPTEELRSMMTEMCVAAQDRAISVDGGIRAGMNDRAHPATLPKNIYGTDGDWEEYSTPSRDARMKVGFKELRDETERFIGMYEAGSKRISYTPAASKYSNQCPSGNDNCFLVASLLEAYDQVSSQMVCQFGYTKSNGARQNVNYEQFVNRLFKLSFDPYHCVELRWGAEGDEAASCPDGGSKVAWYKAEQGLRNQLDRTYDMFMGYDAQETASKLGTSQTPDVNLRSFLKAKLESY